MPDGIPMSTWSEQASDKPRRRPGITPRMRQALENSIWGDAAGVFYPDAIAAGRALGLTARAVRNAMLQPDVKRFMAEQRAAQYSAARTGNVPALVDVRDNSDNAMARVNAVKAIEQIGDEDEREHRGRPTVPGIVLILGQRAARWWRTLTSHVEILAWRTTTTSLS